MQKITTFLWFDDQALQAAKFYVSVFKTKSKITFISRYSEAGPGRKGAVMGVGFKLAGQDFYALNGGPAHRFTPAISLYVSCKNQREIDTLWRKLGRGGKEVACGWLTDKYGLSWQIVPRDIFKLISPPKGMKAMLGMKKLDIAALQKASKSKS